MEVKNIIREKRLELGLTYEELGKIVGVGKSTVRKWETGMIENIKRDNIVALAKALNVSPALIMGWDIDTTNEKKLNNPLSDNEKQLEDKLSKSKQSINALSKKEIILLEKYNSLDTEDKSKVIDYTNLLSSQDKYKKDNKIVELPKKEKQIWEEEGKEHLMPIASHDKEGNFSAEDYKHDDDLMNDENLWR